MKDNEAMIWRGGIINSRQYCDRITADQYKKEAEKETARILEELVKSNPIELENIKHESSKVTSH